ncbi:type VII secretion-associated protein [Corynebacterium yudongzhengii]|uniref:Type VII secretion-associated protein n=1 Tax=Corynebacterium yudongzhengii TaxID=2080740 RepID=A0A2U1T9Y0_9CORY|nr:type VII secretion-associated protein [Corynebacterium yudongzhengii]AWB81285.1 type VII secretion-associated protein [Corynebacterium yudongzhengii]PWC02824.1 type VII secretion-associated protein [Corynebacterium yudongzhengii]
MTNLAAPRTGNPTLGVTVFDSATVFDGLRPSDVVYRYDLPARGITEGWAANAVVDQVRTLAGEVWPEVAVTIDADDEIAETLHRLFATAGVAVEEPGIADAAPEGPDTGEFAEVSAGAAGKHRLASDDPSRLMTLVAIAVAVFILVGGVVWFGLRAVAGAGSEVVEEPPAVQVEPEESVSPEPEPERPASVVLEAGEISVELPEGFAIEEDGDVLRATGPDPELRILIATDPLHGISQEALYAELERQVGMDDELAEFHREGERAAYVEYPEDGSQVRWTSWTEGTEQVSVGCHTRAEASVAQHAACTMAVDSLTIADSGVRAGNQLT